MLLFIIAVRWVCRQCNQINANITDNCHPKFLCCEGGLWSAPVIIFLYYIFTTRWHHWVIFHPRSPLSLLGYRFNSLPYTVLIEWVYTGCILTGWWYQHRKERVIFTFIWCKSKRTFSLQSPDNVESCFSQEVSTTRPYRLLSLNVNICVLFRSIFYKGWLDGV